MATIKLPDGRSVEFEGTPTEQDIAEVYEMTGFPTPSNNVITRTKDSLLGIAKGFGQVVTGAMQNRSLPPNLNPSALLPKDTLAQTSLGRLYLPGTEESNRVDQFFEAKNKQEEWGKLAGVIGSYLIPGSMTYKGTQSLPFLSRWLTRAASDTAVDYNVNIGAADTEAEALKNTALFTPATLVGSGIESAFPFSRLAPLISGVTSGYTADIGSGLAGFRGEDREGLGALVPGLGTAIGGTLGTAGSLTNKAETEQARITNTINRRAEILSQIEADNAVFRRAVDNARRAGLPDPIGFLSGSNLLNRATDKNGTIRLKEALEDLNLLLEPYESRVYDDLVAEGTRISRAQLRELFNIGYGGSRLAGEARTTLQNALKREMAGLLEDVGPDGKIPLSRLQEAKIFRTKNNNYTDQTADAISKDVARVLKEAIEKTSRSLDVRAYNEELSRLYTLRGLLNALNGRKVEGGRLGKHFSGMVGSLVGAKIGGPFGAVAGYEAGKYLRGKQLERVLGQETPDTDLGKGLRGDFGLPQGKESIPTVDMRRSRYGGYIKPVDMRNQSSLSDDKNRYTNQAMANTSNPVMEGTISTPFNNMQGEQLTSISNQSINTGNGTNPTRESSDGAAQNRPGTGRSVGAVSQSSSNTATDNFGGGQGSDTTQYVQSTGVFPRNSNRLLRKEPVSDRRVADQIEKVRQRIEGKTPDEQLAVLSSWISPTFKDKVERMLKMLPPKVAAKFKGFTLVRNELESRHVMGAINWQLDNGEYTFMVNPRYFNEPNYREGAIVDHEFGGHVVYAFLNPSNRQRLNKVLADKVLTNDGLMSDLFDNEARLLLSYRNGGMEEIAKLYINLRGVDPGIDELVGLGFLERGLDNKLIFPNGRASLLGDAIKIYQESIGAKQRLAKLIPDAYFQNVPKRTGRLTAEQVRSYFDSSSDPLLNELHARVAENWSSMPELRKIKELEEFVGATDGKIKPSDYFDQSAETGNQFKLVDNLGKKIDPSKIDGPDPILNAKREITAKDLQGKKHIIPAGEAIQPTRLKNGNIHIIDGVEFVVNKNQYENIKAQSLVGKEPDPFSPELTETTETVLGVAKGRSDDRVNPGSGQGYGEWSEKKHSRTASDYGMIVVQKPLSEDLNKNFYGGHVTAPNQIFHIRGFTDSYKGEPVYFADEFQSDWNLALRKEAERLAEQRLGREALEVDIRSEANRLLANYKKGIQPEPELIDLPSEYGVRERVPGTWEVYDKNENWLTAKNSREKAIEAALVIINDRNRFKIPYTPELDNWPVLAAKRALQEAVARGSKWLMWTNGDQQRARYESISKEVRQVSWREVDNDEKQITVFTRSGSEITMDVNGEGMVTNVPTKSYEKELKGKRLDEIFPGQTWKQFLSESAGKIEGEDLRIGGAWADALYERQMVSIFQDLTGQKAERVDLGLVRKRVYDDDEYYNSLSEEGIDPEVPNDADIDDLVSYFGEDHRVIDDVGDSYRVIRESEIESRHSADSYYDDIVTSEYDRIYEEPSWYAGMLSDEIEKSNNLPIKTQEEVDAYYADPNAARYRPTPFVSPYGKQYKFGNDRFIKFSDEEWAGEQGPRIVRVDYFTDAGLDLGVVEAYAAGKMEQDPEFLNLFGEMEIPPSEKRDLITKIKKIVSEYGGYGDESFVREYLDEIDISEVADASVRDRVSSDPESIAAYNNEMYGDGTYLAVGDMIYRLTDDADGAFLIPKPTEEMMERIREGNLADREVSGGGPLQPAIRITPEVRARVLGEKPPLKEPSGRQALLLAAYFPLLIPLLMAEEQE